MDAITSLDAIVFSLLAVLLYLALLARKKQKDLDARAYCDNPDQCEHVWPVKWTDILETRQRELFQQKRCARCDLVYIREAFVKEQED